MAHSPVSAIRWSIPPSAPKPCAAGKSLANWRAAQVPMYLHNGGPDEADRRNETSNTAYKVLLKTPCIGSGDLMVKAYVNLLGEVGSTMYGEAQADSVRDHGEAWQRSAYADLDGCDMGMNLLAYGLPMFSAELWMEGTPASGLQVNLWGTPSGKGGNIGMPVADQAGLDPRIGRERERLRRIVGHDADRLGAIAEVIKRDWPPLILQFPHALHPAPGP